MRNKRVVRVLSTVREAYVDISRNTEKKFVTKVLSDRCGISIRESQRMVKAIKEEVASPQLDLLKDSVPTITPAPATKSTQLQDLQNAGVALMSNFLAMTNALRESLDTERKERIRDIEKLSVQVSKLVARATGRITTEEFTESTTRRFGGRPEPSLAAAGKSFAECVRNLVNWAIEQQGVKVHPPVDQADGSSPWTEAYGLYVADLKHRLKEFCEVTSWDDITPAVAEKGCRWLAQQTKNSYIFNSAASKIASAIKVEEMTAQISEISKQ
jgi:hypothetical protein